MTLVKDGKATLFQGTSTVRFCSRGEIRLNSNMSVGGGLQLSIREGRSGWSVS